MFGFLGTFGVTGDKDGAAAGDFFAVVVLPS